jgi:septal ring factor EnvC (AmiA/AmiB activator)
MRHRACLTSPSRSTAFRFLVLLGVSLVLTSPALAQRGRGRGSINRMVAARKQQEITQLQAQIDGARKLLDSVTTQGKLSQAQIDAARQSAMSARRALNEAAKENNESNQQIRKMEADMLDAQSDDSEYGKAVTEIHTARRALDKEMHRILVRPDSDAEVDESKRLSELAQLTAEERDELAKSPKFMEKKEALHQAMEGLKAAKLNVFQANDEWKAAHEKHHKIEQDKAKEQLLIRGAANDNSDSRAELRTAAQIAESAQSTIASAQARLHALGEKEKSSTPAKKPDTKKSGS